MPSNVKLLAGASGGEPSDANFKNVTLLLHGDGSNGAQNNTFIDSSTNNFTITRNGNTTQGSFSPYGSNWSNYFDGSTGYLALNAQTALSYGTGDFTLEAWVFPTSINSGFSPVLEARASSSAQTYAFGLRVSGGVYKVELYTGTQYTGSTTVSLNTWTHIAVTRSSGTLRIFVNGVLDTSWSSMTTSVDANASGQRIGVLWDGAGFYFSGYISNFRAVKGTAVYTSAFTPSTTPLTAITNTSLLTCAYNRFRDGSTNNFTITRNGDVKVTNFAPFAPSSSYSTTTNGGSAYFDGTGDYLQTPSDTAFTFSGSLTIEFWINFSSTPSAYVALVAGTTANTQLFITTKIDGTGLRFGLTGVAEYATGSQTWVAGAWYHVALVRNGTDVRFYVNGVNVTDGTATNSTSYSGALILGGNVGGTVNLSGYISNFRVVKGTAVYTAAFTPPSAPVTAITNTSLLCNFTNAAIFDNSMKNDLETVGNAQISTSVKKFGTGSMYFDGTGDQLTMPANPDVDVSSGNFTVEAWVYPTSSSGIKTVYANWFDSTSGGVIFGINSGTPALWWRPFDNASPMVTGPSVSNNTWTHIAVVRSGNTFTIYTNGVAGTPVSYSTNCVAGEPFMVGAYARGGSGEYVGYIDELRVTKGVARYTANFTAPTAPFPNK